MLGPDLAVGHAGCAPLGLGEPLVSHVAAGRRGVQGKPADAAQQEAASLFAQLDGDKDNALSHEELRRATRQDEVLHAERRAWGLCG